MLYVIDRQTDNVLMTFTNDNPQATPFDDSSGGLTESLETGVATYKFDVLKKFEDAQFIIGGNNVAFRDKKGKDRLLQILNVSEDKNVRTAYCVDSNLVLNNEIARSYEADKEYTAAEYIKRFLPNYSGFEVGMNQIAHLKRKLIWEGMDTVTKRIRSVATQFDNAQIGFRVQMINSHVVGRYVDLYQKRGKSIGETLEYGREIDGIQKEEDLTELGTALIGEGGVIEGSETQEKVTIKDIVYDDGRYFTPQGDDILYDREAGAFWKKYRPNMAATDGYIKKSFSFDTNSSQELFNRMLSRLKKINKPTSKYTVDIALLPDSVDIGDTIRIVDHDYQPALYLDADVLEMTTKQTIKGQDVVVLGNFIEKESKIDKALRLAQEAMAQSPLQALYEWRAYATDDQGTNFSMKYDSTKTYMAIKFVRNQPIPSTEPADYKDSWARINGPQGPQGPQGGDGPQGPIGVPGPDGKTYYPWIVYADDVNGGGISLNGNDKQYEGVGTGESPTPSLDPKKYRFSYRYDHTVYEKVQQEIAKVPVVTVGSVRPTNPKHGDQFWQEDAHGNITGYFKYVVTGSTGKWESQTVDQALLNIYELNAVKINGSVINGSQFVTAFDAIIEGQQFTGISKTADGKVRTDYTLPATNQTGFTELNPRGLIARLNRAGTTETDQEFAVDFGGFTLRKYWGGRLIGGSMSANDFYDSGWIQLTAINGWSFQYTNMWGYVRQRGSKIMFRGRIGGKAGDNLSQIAIVLPVAQFLNWQNPETRIFTLSSYGGTGFNDHRMRCAILNGTITVASSVASSSFYDMTALSFDLNEIVP